MRRIATSFARHAATVAAGAVIVFSAAFGASGSSSTSAQLDLSSVVSTWQVGEFPELTVYGAFGSILEQAIREEFLSEGPLAVVEDRVPSWSRPQPQTRLLAGEVSGTPARLFLEQNYPNPFNPSTMIRYGVPGGMRVKLSVHTLLGSQIRVLVDQWHEPGTYTFDFVGADLPSGAYFYRLQTDVGTITRRMIISK